MREFISGVSVPFPWSVRLPLYVPCSVIEAEVLSEVWAASVLFYTGLVWHFWVFMFPWIILVL